MLRDGGFEAVSIVTPDHLHADIAVKCAAAGKHMLIEKPLATTREDVFRIMDAVKAAGVRAVVDLHIRLNDIKWVATDMLPWAAKPSILWFLGSHSFDTLQWLFQDRVKRVYTVSNRGVLDALNVPTEDVFLTTLEFEKGGIAQMENGWITPNANPCVNDKFCPGCKAMGTRPTDLPSAVASFQRRAAFAARQILYLYRQTKPARLSKRSCAFRKSIAQCILIRPPKAAESKFQNQSDSMFKINRILIVKSIGLAYNNEEVR